MCPKPGTKFVMGVTVTIGAKLSKRELEALTLIAGGCTTSEASHTMNISPRTLEVYLARSRVKLNARTTIHAVALAYEKGLISKGEEP
jgi:DNA-binding CsgD family transcriptional regulator